MLLFEVNSIYNIIFCLFLINVVSLSHKTFFCWFTWEAEKDFESLKEDEKFLKIVTKIEKYNNEISKKIIEEEIIGEFYNLKFYIN